MLTNRSLGRTTSQLKIWQNGLIYTGKIAISFCLFQQKRQSCKFKTDPREGRKNHDDKIQTCATSNIKFPLLKNPRILTCDIVLPNERNNEGLPLFWAQTFLWLVVSSAEGQSGATGKEGRGEDQESGRTPGDPEAVQGERAQAGGELQDGTVCSEKISCHSPR